MQKLIQGIHHFQNHIFREKQELFCQLATGQAPSTLFITCSDSRINPNLVTQTEPGEIFVLRNAGNIVPPAPELSGELATIEFAIRALKVRDIVVCGHSDCGAMKAVLDPSQTAGCPAVSHWLRHASRTGEIINQNYSHLTGYARLMTAIEENVIVQIENLRTHSIIEENLANGNIKIHGWIYKFEKGEMFTYDPTPGQFVSLSQSHHDLIPAYPRANEVFARFDAVPLPVVAVGGRQ